MLRSSSRTMSRAVSQLKEVLNNKIKEQGEKIKYLKTHHKDEVLSKSTIDNTYGGMRGLTALVYEPSLLDANEGIRFRGLTIPECQQKLTKFQNTTQMMPEAMLWLLLTGDVPTAEQTETLRQDLFQRAQSNQQLLNEMYKTLDTLPKDLHPMSQFVIAILALQKDSKFAEQYSTGTLKKGQYWEYTLEDALNCIARIPYGAARIFCNVYRDGRGKDYKPDSNLDWTANFVNAMGFTSKDFQDCMRLYLAIHVDHEGGNVSAHTTMLVGSALSDSYLSYAGGMTGLAGPLHGLANQEVLAFLDKVQKDLEAKGISLERDTDDAIRKALSEQIWSQLKAGQVIPGYGHAVLRQTDPRYSCQREFAQKHFPNFPLFRLVSLMYELTPNILTEQGKVKNPFPNVDAHSGCLLQYYGMKEQNFYTVLFGLSRGLGVLSALVWERALMKPIERPKSVTTDSLYAKYHKK